MLSEVRVRHQNWIDLVLLAQSDLGQPCPVEMGKPFRCPEPLGIALPSVSGQLRAFSSGNTVSSGVLPSRA